MPSCSPKGIEQLTSESKFSWQSDEMTQEDIQSGLAE
jgi:hypothetical protein